MKSQIDGIEKNFVKHKNLSGEELGKSGRREFIFGQFGAKSGTSAVGQDFALKNFCPYFAFPGVNFLNHVSQNPQRSRAGSGRLYHYH